MAPSTPTDGVQDVTAEQLHKLASLKADIVAMEEERRALNEKREAAITFLLSTPVGLFGPLVDAEGRPRSDCDLNAIRAAHQMVAFIPSDIRAVDERLHICRQLIQELTAEHP